MKLTKNLTLTLVVAGLLLSGASVAAKPTKSKRDKAIIEQLQSGLPVHMPARAAAIVKEAPAAERKEVALRVLSHTIALKPQLAASVVTHLSQAAPEATADLITLAKQEAPQQVQALEALPQATALNQAAVSAPAAGGVTATAIKQGGAFKASANRTKANTGELGGSPQPSNPNGNTPPPFDPTKTVPPATPGSTKGVKQGAPFRF